MNKISITNLEKARMNPSKFGKSMLDGTLSSATFGGRPKSMKWHDAVMEYHNTNDISKAVTRLENSFSNRKDTAKNRREVEDLRGVLKIRFFDFYCICFPVQIKYPLLIFC